jgi:hypothetical protein
MKKFSLSLAVAILVLVGSFGMYKIALAVRGEGTATIAKDGGVQSGGVTVVQSTSHTYTVILTVGASGITADAENPTFTIPTGFTAPDATYVANAGLVVADGNWSVIGGGTCLVESPVAGLTKAVGQVITVDVSTACTVGGGGIITLTYKGTSSTVGVTSVDVGVNDVISYTPVKSISEPPNNATLPTITVTGSAAATLTVIKHIINDNGGTSAAGSWLLTVSSSNSGSGTGNAVGSESGTVYTLETGKQYSVVESGGPSGYSASASSDCTIASAVVSTAYTCTITNDDTAPQLIVIKTVINDNSGVKAVADFPLFIDGVGVTSGVANTTTIGAHTVSETLSAGYTASVWAGDCAAAGTITLALGEIKTCTITNDDISVQPSGSGSGGAYTPPVPPLIDVLKVPSPLALPGGSGFVTYTYTLRNIGTVPVASITMVGDTCSPIVLISGDTNNDAKLDVSETWVYTCSTILSATHTNIVTATGWANSINAVDIASATVVVGASVVPPLIHVTKVPSVFALASPGGAVTYTYTVTNPGTAPLSDVSITDDKCTGLPGRVVGHPGDLNQNNLLESNETWTFTCQTKLTKTTTNTGTAAGSANGLTARDFAIATVVVSSLAPKFPNTGFDPGMSEFLKMDIFFIIASVATIILVVLLIILLIYLIRFIKNLKYISDKARIEVDNLTQDIQAFRESIYSLFGFLINKGKKGK